MRTILTTLLLLIAVNCWGQDDKKIAHLYYKDIIGNSIPKPTYLINFKADIKYSNKFSKIHLVTSDKFVIDGNKIQYIGKDTINVIAETMMRIDSLDTFWRIEEQGCKFTILYLINGSEMGQSISSRMVYKKYDMFYISSSMEYELKYGDTIQINCVTDQQAWFKVKYLHIIIKEK